MEKERRREVKKSESTGLSEGVNKLSTNWIWRILAKSNNVLCCGVRIRELERSERSLLPQLYQLASASHLPSMQHSQKLDQRLHVLREEVRAMTQEKERGERIWRDRLQRCQRQLKAKEEEMTRQSQYFENFKTQLQHKLSLARDREQSLQNRIYSLEKQLLDMTVSAATGMSTISAARITAGTVTHWEELSMRGEGEGEEERKEERRRQWQPSVGTEREGGRAGDEGKTEEEIPTGRVKDTKQDSNEARLQGFILSLQEDLRVLLEREENGVTERRGLMEQLQEAQENSHFLGCKVEEIRAEVHQMKLSESSLMEEVEELREENHRLQQIRIDIANQTPSQSSTVPESTCLGPHASSPSCSPVVCPVPSNPLSHTTAKGHSSVGSSGEVHLTSSEEVGQPHSSAVPPVHHQAPAERPENNTEDHSSSAKSETPTNPSLQTLSLTTETLDEFKLGTWCSRGTLNLEESPSEESDALMEAYRSLGLGEDLEALQEQRDRLEVALQYTQEQLQMMAQENTRLKLQLRKEAEEREAEADLGPSGEKVWDGLVQALNQENRALADRIQQLLSHIELREEEIKREETQVREHISKLEADGVRLELENQEHACLITELTKKTEDDLNTIMELQQRLEEREQHLEECVDRLVESVLKGEEPQLMSSQQPGDSTAASAPGSQHNYHFDPLQNSLQSSLHVSSLTDQVGQLTKSVQSLKTEQEELSDDLNSLREQQREVALSVQTQTEVKKQLTRTVWGLKEEKDGVSQSLTGLRQEREQLTRTVCGLRDERDQFIRSMSGLKEEKELLTKSLSGLQREKEKLLEYLSSGKEESDQIMMSLQSLQTERDQLSQAVQYLKQERDGLTNSLKCLKEQRDQEQSSYTLQEDHDKLIKSVSSLREEEERSEHSIICLKQEENQIKLLLQGLREERNSLQADLPRQTQSEGWNQKQHLLNPNTVVKTKTETCVGTDEYATQRCQTDDHRGNPVQEQSDLMREIEALGAELKRSRGELDKSHIDTKRLHSELRQSEARREEAERGAVQAADEVMRLTDVANRMEETRKDSDSLIIQVKELQSKLAGLVREKTDALSLKAQIEEQYNILTAQLKAKTVALEELNSEYIALKRGPGSKEDLSTVLVSLRTRYNDIRAKYDALLKQRSQRDLDIAPLKAKLSCLVLKCQERNSLLVQMRKAMHRRGCVDPTLTQQVEQLLSDAALQDYTAAFTPGSILSPSASGPEKFGFHHPDMKGKSSPEPASLTGSSLSPTPPSSSTRVSRNGRLSSPEKIINLHEQLQKTLLSSYQAPVSRGRGLQPRKNLSFSAPADLRPASQRKTQSLSFNTPHTSSLPVTTASSQAERTPAVTATPVATNKSTTLFNAVASRSADVTFSPNTFTKHRFEADISKTTTSALSSSSNVPFATMTPSKSTLSSTANVTISPKLTKKITAIPDVSEAKHTTLRTTTFDSDVLICSDTNPKTTALDTTAPSMDGASPTYDRLVFAASCTQSAHWSPERSNKSPRRSTDALEKTKTVRPKPEAPAEVRSVEVIKTVGQSSLMIGWERPSLDELGYSNGTFVYGYRVFVDGDFHKSVMSSACTKCILENVDLSVPVHISVQTLGSNGLSSNSVHTMYRTSDYRNFLVKTFTASGRGLNSIYSCSPLRDRPNLHLSSDGEGDAITLPQAQVNQSEKLVSRGHSNLWLAAKTSKRLTEDVKQNAV
ncbi:trichohyalin-like [Enoplosus armatus]|uniref:trichohyalin-like n=1 Tax=Enoplosus armatus TaxID=215367 RepID=UPI0039925A53